MTTYIARRILLLIPLLLGISLVTFIGMHVVPGDASSALTGQGVSAADIARVRRQLHLDQPIVVQYGYFLAGIVHGDFGMSLRTHDPVMQDVAQALPTTI